MPSLTKTNSNLVKLLFIGHSGAGKTGALCSLAAAGYKLRILDLDNGIDIIRGMLTSPKSPYPPSSVANVHYISLTEKMTSANGKIFPQSAKVWPKALDLLNRWKEGEDDLGVPSEWGPETVLVIDSMTALSTAALNYHLQVNGRLVSGSSGNEYRRDIGVAQGMMENLLQLLVSKQMTCNVIVISHVVFVEDDEADASLKPEDRPKIGLPTALGKALSPRIPRLFNSTLQAKIEGSGVTAKHVILTKSLGVVALKTSAPLKVKKSYPLETGLADYFKALKDE